MKVEWFNHTGIVVQDMEKMLAFYKDVLELEEERNRVLEGPLADQLVGYKDAKLHVIYLGNGDMRHSVELVTYLNPPPGETMHTNERNTIGAVHIGVIVDDLDAWYEDLTARGIRFVNKPFLRKDAEYPWAFKACYLQDPEGNWLEFIERPPAPPGATAV